MFACRGLLAGSQRGHVSADWTALRKLLFNTQLTLELLNLFVLDLDSVYEHLMVLIMIDIFCSEAILLDS